MKEQFLLLLPILFPVIAGMVLLISKLEDREKGKNMWLLL